MTAFIITACCVACVSCGERMRGNSQIPCRLHDCRVMAGRNVVRMSPSSESSYTVLRDRSDTLGSLLLAMHPSRRAFANYGTHHHHRHRHHSSQRNGVMIGMDSWSKITRNLERKDFLTAVSSLAILSAFFSSRSAFAGEANSTQYPPIEYLAPIYELKASLDALASAAKDETRWPALAKRLDAFFAGGPLSERFFYLGLSQQYTDKIVYNDLDVFMQKDKDERRQAMESVMTAMEKCQTSLKAKSPDGEIIRSSIEAAQHSMAQWLSLAPQSDVLATKGLLLKVQSVDVNRDGKLEEDELNNLSDAVRQIWERKVALVGK